MIGTLAVIAKRPVAGRVKTRLVPPLTYGQAAELAAAALADTLRAVDATPAKQRLLAFDGRIDGWLPAGWTHCDQPSGGLDRRLVAAFVAAGSGPTLLVGMDTPQLRPDLLTAFDPVRYDACLGLAADGGYWAIGFRDPTMAASAIAGVPMSTERTADEQLGRLARLGLSVQLLAELVDVDTIDDAFLVAQRAPGTAFAAALSRVDAPLAQVG
jgi:glycosyltransferase A (GT-A) superfamily protein (DUF2064 family)